MSSISMIAKLDELVNPSNDLCKQENHLTVPNLNSRCSSETNLSDLKDTPLENSIQNHDWTLRKRRTKIIRKSLTPEPVKKCKSFQNACLTMLFN